MSTRDEIVWFDHMPSPIGPLLLAADAQGLREVGFEHGKYRSTPDPHWQHAPRKVDFARRQLEEYFNGERQRFDLPLHLHGTPFQVSVWQMLASIPYGQTTTYAGLAARIGKPQAVRAVGAANGRNPISIVAPCHRVIGANGDLTGFAGGLETKQYLLKHERKSGSSNRADADGSQLMLNIT